MSLEDTTERLARWVGKGLIIVLVVLALLFALSVIVFLFGDWVRVRLG